MSLPPTVTLADVVRWAGPYLGPDRGVFVLAMIYGSGIALLTLAVPISVQMLINAVAYTGLPAPLFTLSGVLLFLLLCSAVMGAFRKHLMELFRRRFLARVVADVTLRAVYAQNPFFDDSRRADLFNRFFDVMTVQKAIPSLLIGLFTIILQAGIGFVVTAFYHPFFLAFNLSFVFTLWLIWIMWARGAMRSAVELSHAKYRLAQWLESIGLSNGFYKSSRHLDFAMDRTEEQTAAYVAAHTRHFRYIFPQTVSLLILYALASAGLLALGGWLVIQGQLSIGQLVAAELILSSIFYGASQLGPYLDSFYDLVAAFEELDMFRQVPQELSGAGESVRRSSTSGALSFASVCAANEGATARFDFEIPPHSRLIAGAAPGVSRLFDGLLKRHIRSDSGLITLGGADISDLNLYEMRSDVIVLNRPTIVETSIRDYLSLASRERDPVRTIAALKSVGLAGRLAELPQGLDTLLSGTGWPLSLAETMSLKLAAALIAQPQILVLSELFDMLPVERLRTIFDGLHHERMTIIYFTSRPADLTLDAYLWLGRGEQRIVKGRGEFDRLRMEPQQ